MYLICNQLHLTGCTAAFFSCLFLRGCDAWNGSFHLWDAPSNRVCSANEPRCPCLYVCSLQPCQPHGWNKTANSNRVLRPNPWFGWELRGCMDEIWWTGRMTRMLKWCHMAWKGDYSIFYVCSMINSPVKLQVMRKTQTWENPDLSVGWLPGVGNHLLLYSQVAPGGNNDKQKRAFPHYVWQ